MKAVIFHVMTAVVLSLSAPAFSAETQVAVAANFAEPAKAIAEAFHQKTGDTAVLSIGASGVFYAQIAHGAPFDVFLSADAERPVKAEQAHLAVPGTRFTYAIGQLVLYSTKPGLVDAKGAVLRSGRFNKLAIADPAVAPYGVAAGETLNRLGLYAALAPKLVKGSSLTQAYQFVATGAAELGFVALSQVMNQPGGSRWLVPARLHAPIDQQAVLLNPGAQSHAARAFMDFLKSAQARSIIKRYGYTVR